MEWTLHAASPLLIVAVVILVGVGFGAAARRVGLPGITGQILAGVSPMLAIRYQIVVMFMLASAVAASAVIVVLWNRRLFFTSDEQLRLPGSRPG